MGVMPTNSIDKRLAEIYADKVTVNLDRTSSVNPDEIWKSMQIVASNNKALLKIIYK